ncbi:hypothetical protein E3U47_18005 [Pseudomonas sp. RIT623]|nr:hypothetical protein E3U47_18005 [Pseudomonas sp. RIT623]
MDYPKSLPNAGLVGGKFIDEDVVNGTPGSLIPSAWGNAVTDELLSVIVGAGMVPNEADLTQLLKAIRLIVQGGSGAFAVDTGIANTYVVAYAPAITAFTDGLRLSFRAKTANSGASTFAPNGLVAKPLLGLSKVALQGGEIVADGQCTVVWSAAIDSWILISSTGGALQVAEPTKSNHAVPFAWLPKRSFAANDYIRVPDVPGGLIVQWGVGTLPASGTTSSRTTVTYPTRFPTAARLVVAMGTGTINTNGYASIMSTDGYDAVAASLTGDSNQTIVFNKTCPFVWLALGN